MSKGLVGIRNTGNTCYLAAVIQCISHCKSAVTAIFSTEPNAHGVTAAVQRLCERTWLGDSRDLSPRRLVNALKKRADSYMDYDEQNDAHEFLVALVAAIESEAPPLEESRHPLGESHGHGMQRLLHGMRSHWKIMVADKNCDLTMNVIGQNTFLTQCHACDHVSQSFDVFLAMPLFLRSGTACLQAQIDDQSNHAETLDGFSCERCRQRTFARRECKVSMLPTILIVQVMRFQEMRKDSGAISIEEDIDLASMCLKHGHSKYRLSGMVCHQGSSQCGGHYYAVCRIPGERWAVFDDDSVSEDVQVQDVHRGDPYLLFYELVVGPAV